MLLLPVANTRSVTCSLTAGKYAAFQQKILGNILKERMGEGVNIGVLVGKRGISGWRCGYYLRIPVKHSRILLF